MDKNEQVRARVARVCMAGAMMLTLAGCGKLSHHDGPSKYVFVTAKEATLRDRVAAVSNRTGTVTNGEKLTVLQHARRFLQVKTADGKVGWLEDKPSMIADQSTADAFDDLRKKHENDPTVALATARDEVLMHVAPGRQSAVFFRLAEGDKLNLLSRAMVAKPLPPGQKAAPPTAPKDGSAPVPDGPVMEDWWLARNAKGDTGWVYSHLIDVSAPDALARYAEGQRIVGAYVLAKADDPESGMMDNGTVVTSIPEYLTVLSPYKAGLPYDFDQVRVFTWNVKKHRYETAFREHNIMGYLPVKISAGKDPYGKSPLAAVDLPVFKYKVLAAEAPVPTPDVNGLIVPAKTVEKTYRMEGTTVRRILATGTTAPEEMHPVVEEKKDKKAKRKKK